MKCTLTDKFVRSLQPAAPGKRDQYWDTLVPRFGVRVTDKGAKSYIVYTRWPGTGKPARRALGDTGRLSLAVARQRARVWLELVEQGTDPKARERERALEEQRRRKTTFAAVAEDWLREAVVGRNPARPTQRKGLEVQRDVRREFVSAWGQRPINSITTLDLRTVIKSKAAAAPAQACWAMPSGCSAGPSRSTPTASPTLRRSGCALRTSSARKSCVSACLRTPS